MDMSFMPPVILSVCRAKVNVLAGGTLPETGSRAGAPLAANRALYYPYVTRHRSS
jgi:hypothetical protein